MSSQPPLSGFSLKFFSSSSVLFSIMFDTSLSLLLLLSPFKATAETKCYAPNGRVADDTYMPCIAIDGVHSMCCNLNTSTLDTCQSNGLCLSNAECIFQSNY